MRRLNFWVDIDLPIEIRTTDMWTERHHNVEFCFLRLLKRLLCLDLEGRMIKYGDVELC
jgi:hypothetical protein